MSTTRDRKLTAVTRYTIDVQHFDDGSINVMRRNQGMSGVLLLGLLEVAKRDVYASITDQLPAAQRYAGPPVAQSRSSIRKK